MRDTLVRISFLALLAVSTAACADVFGPDPDTVEEGELTIVSFAPDAPPLTTLDASFYAVKGEDREVQIRYLYPNGATGKCLRFVVPAGALLRDRNGQPFEAGDSVLIRVRVLDPELFMFQFDPGGLQFDPTRPARLEIDFDYAAADLDGDGVEGDPDDLAMRGRFALWKQERSGDPWRKVAARRDDDENEIVADIEGFTRYALAAD